MHNHKEARSVEQLLYNALPARYSEDGTIRIAIVSLIQDTAGVIDDNEYFGLTGKHLTEELVETQYLEVDTVCTFDSKYFEHKIIPAIFETSLLGKVSQ